MRIVFFDDDKYNMPHFSDLLRHLGADVFQARSLGELTQLLETYEFELLILDLMMPNLGFPESERYMTGIEIFQQLKTDSVEEIPFLVYSAAHASAPPIAQKLEQLKSNNLFLGFFRKGRDEEILVQLIKSMIR